jgi:hypothetical protein
MSVSNAKQCAIDETKSGGNPFNAIAWAILHLANVLEGKR